MLENLADTLESLPESRCVPNYHLFAGLLTEDPNPDRSGIGVPFPPLPGVLRKLHQTSLIPWGSDASQYAKLLPSGSRRRAENTRCLGFPNAVSELNLLAILALVCDVSSASS